MIESLELRVVEDFANRLFRPDEGKLLGSGIVRLVRIQKDDPRLCEISSIQSQIDKECGRSFFHGWEILRKYSREEIKNAACFHLLFKSTFEPAGEECGTTYDESIACPRCGAGAKQTSSLFLDVKRIPKSKDVCRTIAGEIVVSRRVVELFARHGITGVELLPVRTKGASSVESKEWFQLIVQGSVAEISGQTRVGINPFDDDEIGECRCSLGDLVGLNLLSEITIASASRGSADIIRTRQFIGIRRGLLRPEQLILISPKLAKLIESEKIKGCGYEVAHLV
jgi:hypothetical protein